MRQRLEAALQGVVVVAAARIDRDDAAVRCIEQGQRIVLGRIIDAEHDHRPRLGPQRARIAAPCRGAGEPAHIAVITASEELAESGARLGVETRFGETDRIEAGG